MQGHNSKTFKWKSHKVSKQNSNLDEVKDHKWVCKEQMKIFEDKENSLDTRVAISQKGETSQLEKELFNLAEKTWLEKKKLEDMNALNQGNEGNVEMMGDVSVKQVSSIVNRENIGTIDKGKQSLNGGKSFL